MSWHLARYVPKLKKKKKKKKLFKIALKIVQTPKSSSSISTYPTTIFFFFLLLSLKSNPMEGMIRSSANYTPLSPISFLKRSALVYNDKSSIVYGDVQYTWKDTFERCTKLASALAQLGISRGDVVSTDFLTYILNFCNI